MFLTTYLPPLVLVINTVLHNTTGIFIRFIKEFTFGSECTISACVLTIIPLKPPPPYTLQRKASGSFRRYIVREHISALLKRGLHVAAVNQPRF